jgi:hypothetical protein
MVGWNLFTVNLTPGSEVDMTTLLGNRSWGQIIGYSQEDGTFTTILPDTGGILIGGLGYYIYMHEDSYFLHDR